ncbi:anaphase-promoting complex subunit 15-like [Danaus plexippus]|uniref:anaphase-promoting complex subunit 15-like n=1 Tax=Danaus plexippus TaxID=13037 RepID=UPI002AAF1E08|nr:anaphase-promoting complex subunit 15-like [Danaus plexippus]
MNIPFPIIYPRMIAPDFFNSDKPCDEDAELTSMEQANHRWLNSIGKKYMKHTPVEKPQPEPMEEAETDDDVFIVTGNEEGEESEESHDVDEEEEMPTTESPPRNTEAESESPEDITDTADIEVEASLWPYTPQDE